MRRSSYAHIGHTDVAFVSTIGISWFQVIKANDDLTPEHHQFFLYQMLRGLKYIHTGKAHTLLMASLDLPSSLDASDASVENAA